MPEDKELTATPGNDDGGGSAPVAGSEGQKKLADPRLAAWMDTMTRAYIVCVSSYFAGDVEKSRQIRRRVDDLDRLCGREIVDGYDRLYERVVAAVGKVVA